MNNEKAIAILERKTTIPSDGYTWEEIEEAIEMAIDALKMPEKGDPLTIEQLRKMNNTPIWVIPIKSEHDYCGWCVVSVSDSGDKYSCAEIPGVEYWSWSFESYGERWIAYAYQPAHSDREAWTAKWEKRESPWNGYTMVCSKCGETIKSLSGQMPFCPSCGRAMTPEAQAELEKRLRG